MYSSWRSGHSSPVHGRYPEFRPRNAVIILLVLRHPPAVPSLCLGGLKGLQTAFDALSSDVSPGCSAARCHSYLSHTARLRATNSLSLLQGHFLPPLCPCQLCLSSSPHPLSYSHHQSKQPPGKGICCTPSFSFITLFLSSSHGFL